MAKTGKCHFLHRAHHHRYVELSWCWTLGPYFSLWTEPLDLNNYPGKSCSCSTSLGHSMTDQSSAENKQLIISFKLLRKTDFLSFFFPGFRCKPDFSKTNLTSGKAWSRLATVFSSWSQCRGLDVCKLFCLKHMAWCAAFTDPAYFTFFTTWHMGSVLFFF